MQTKEDRPWEDPTHIGYYVKDMPNMPSWEERERLRKEAESEGPDSIAARRLKLWDYFFRIKPQDLGKPQREEISQLKKTLKELEKLEKELELERQITESNVGRKFKDERESRVLGGFIIIVIGVVMMPFGRSDNNFDFIELIGILCLIIGSLLIVANLLAPPEDEVQVNKSFYLKKLEFRRRARDIITGSADKPQAITALEPTEMERKRDDIERDVLHEQNKARDLRLIGIGIGALLLDVDSVPDFNLSNLTLQFTGIVIIFLAWFLTRKKLSDNFVEDEINKRLSVAYDKMKSVDSRTPEAVEYYINSAKNRIKAWSLELERLIEQIPNELPSDKEVDAWFAEVMNCLEEKAIKETGMKDRVAKGMEKGSQEEKIFCIHGPAELQKEEPEQEKILRSYERNEDNKYHLRARHFTFIDDKFADFYGVYYIEFILVGRDVLVVYSTFYDFIMHRQFSPRTRMLHYVDIVSVQTAQDYIILEWGDDQKIDLDGVPSLTFSLPSSERIRITYPNGDYIKKTRHEENESLDSSDSKFDEGKWKFNMEEDAKEANKHIREQMQTAKNQLRGL